MNEFLVISDTHFGKKTNLMKLNRIEDLASNFQNIILLGDLWDNLYTTFEEFISDPIYQNLFHLLSLRNTIYLYGNHDPISDNEKKLYGFCKVVSFKYSLKMGDNVYHFEHGDLLLDKSKARTLEKGLFPIFDLFGKAFFAKLINPIFNFIIQFTQGKNPLGKNWNERIKSEVVGKNSYFDDKIIVCGHTHHQHQSSNYINIGSNQANFMQYMIISESGYQLFNSKY
jgi:UDP-2,3-diacylglucosamine pyrophosphatase LpxH